MIYLAAKWLGICVSELLVETMCWPPTQPKRKANVAVCLLHALYTVPSIFNFQKKLNENVLIFVVVAFVNQSCLTVT